MSIDLTGLVRPHQVEMVKREDNPNFAEFRLQPLERGFGYTLGNSLRRMLLSSLRGTAVWGLRMDGVVHEHQTVPGVLEDVHQIIQRLKALTLVLAEEVDEAILKIRKDSPGPVYARDIQLSGSVRIVNPDHLLFTLQDEREITGELYVNKGRGYVESRTAPGGPLPAGRPDPDRLDLQSGPPRQLHRLRDPRRPAHRLRPAHGVGGDQRQPDAGRRHRLCGGPGPGALPPLRGVRQGPDGAGPSGAAGAGDSQLQDQLGRLIDDFGLSVRSLNSLKNSNIRTLGDLVRYTEDELLKVKNVGEKALSEIAELLRREGLNFGMDWEEADGDLRVTQRRHARRRPRPWPTGADEEV